MTPLRQASKVSNEGKHFLRCSAVLGASFLEPTGAVCFPKKWNSDMPKSVEQNAKYNAHRASVQTLPKNFAQTSP